MIQSLSLHPGLFARGWLNVAPVAKISAEYENCVILEEHRDGVWLAAIAPEAIACAWVPKGDGDVDLYPEWSEAPVADPVIISDGNGRVANLMKQQWDLWKKVEPGFDDYLGIFPAAGEVDPKKPSLPGMEVNRVRFRVEGNLAHVDAVEVDKPVVSWRTIVDISVGSRSRITLPMNVMKALGSVEGCKDPIVAFSNGSGALLHFEPESGSRVHTFAYVAVGQREQSKPEPTKLESLVTQEYDEDTEEYVDVPLTGPKAAAERMLQLMDD